MAAVIDRRRGGLVCALCLVAACASDPTDDNGDGVADGILQPNNVSVITPTRPRGHVAGQIVDGLTGRPLAGATVKLFGGALTGELTTDATGDFQFGPLSAGARFTIRVTAPNHTEAALPDLVIDDAAGNFPTDNGALWVGPIGLVPTTGRFSVQVVGETGDPVQNARVTMESAIAWFDGERARGSVARAGTTDADGRVTVEGLPDVWSLPPRRESLASLVVNVAPVDLDGDMRPDLRGTTLELSGVEVRAGARLPLIVLQASDDNVPLQIVASNIPALAGAPGGGPPAVLEPTDPIRVVFNQAIDLDTLVVEITDETGDNQLATSPVLGVLGNVLRIQHDTSFQIGQEHNLVISARTRDAVPPTAIRRGAPFFAAPDPGTGVRATASFVDLNEDTMWGNGRDELRIRFDQPLGRPGTNPAFTIELWLELDLNGSMTIGDGPGELPELGAEYPPAIQVNAAEPSPPNGAGLSGFTRFVAPVRIGLPTPLDQLQGPVPFEVRLVQSGVPVTDPSGNRPPPRLEGAAQLTQP